MNEYFESLLKTINDSITNLNEDEFNSLVEDTENVLKNDRKIIVTGLGKNVPICDKFVGTMLSMGMNAAFLHTNTAVHGDLGTVRDGDLVVILSKSGKTSESVYLLGELKKRNVKIWSITFNPDSPLAKEADACLLIPMDHEGDLWDIVPNNSTTLYLIVLQALAITLSKNMGIKLEEFKKNHPGGHIGVQLNGRA